MHLLTYLRRQASPAPTVPSAPSSEVDFRGEHAAIRTQVVEAKVSLPPLVAPQVVLCAKPSHPLPRPQERH